MKKGLSAREKVLLLILILMMVFAGYYYAFYIPSQEKIAYYDNEALLVDDEIIVAEGKSYKLSMMKQELKDILAGDSNVKPLPQYDNSSNVMNSLSEILANASQYNISFAGVSEKDGIVRRDITLTFSTKSYDVAKIILSNIYNGDYRCMMKDLHITQSSGIWNVNVQITYFEYK